MQKIARTSIGMSARKERSKEAFMPPVNTSGIMETMDKEKAELSDNYFASVFLATSLPTDSSGWKAGWGLGKQRLHKRRSAS